MHTRLLDYISATKWAIDLDYAAGRLPYVLGRVVDSVELPGVGPREKSAAAKSIPDGVSYYFASGVVGKYLGMSEGGIDLADMSAALSEFRDGPDGAMVLHLDTPGGSVYGVAAIAQKIVDIQELGKIVIAYTDTMAASAGQWIMSAADVSIADAHATVGSVGVCSVHVDRSRLYDASGIRIERFASGSQKGAGLLGIELTDDQRAVRIESVESLCVDFRKWMQSRRGDLPETMLDGRGVSGSDALRAGMVDFLSGDLEEVLAFAKTFA